MQARHAELQILRVGPMKQSAMGDRDDEPSARSQDATDFYECRGSRGLSHVFKDVETCDDVDRTVRYVELWFQVVEMHDREPVACTPAQAFHIMHVNVA